MENLVEWTTPLLLLPGVALLILSTSLRYGQIHDEFHHLDGSDQHSKATAKILLHRARLFRNALVYLYSSFASFCLASLLGGLATQWMSISGLTVLILTCAGILGLVVASITLVRESRLSLDVIEAHFQHLEKKPAKD